MQPRRGVYGARSPDWSAGRHQNHRCAAEDAAWGCGDAVNWVICIDNTGFEASLEARKLYNVEHDVKAQAVGMIRVVDESGEGYLYPQEMFAPIAIQNSLEGQLLAD